VVNKKKANSTSNTQNKEEVRKYAMISWMDRGWKYSLCTLDDTVFSDIRFVSEDDVWIQDKPDVLKSFYIYTPFYHAIKFWPFEYIYLLHSYLQLISNIYIDSGNCTVRFACRVTLYYYQ
jgi:hypothetical protein